MSRAAARFDRFSFLGAAFRATLEPFLITLILFIYLDQPKFTRLSAFVSIFPPQVTQAIDVPTVRFCEASGRSRVFFSRFASHKQKV